MILYCTRRLRALVTFKVHDGWSKNMPAAKHLHCPEGCEPVNLADKDSIT